MFGKSICVSLCFGYDIHIKVKRDISIYKDIYDNDSEGSDDSVNSTDAEFSVLTLIDGILDVAELTEIGSISEESNIEVNHGGVGLVSLFWHCLVM